MAEAHPVAFRFVMQARERGATVVHVDPRFSRTSALADLHVPIRPGSDVAFLDGLFSGFDAERREYDPATWAYRAQGGVHAPPDEPTEQGSASGGVRPGAP